MNDKIEDGAGAPRAERLVPRGPRAGRLQQDWLHFGIWHICPRFATIRLFSLQPAHFRDAKFLRQQSAKKLCAKSGNVRPITMVGGWAAMF